MFKNPIAAATLLSLVLGGAAMAQTAGQDMKNAGRDTKNAAKSAGKGTAHAAKTAGKKTKNAVKKATGDTH